MDSASLSRSSCPNSAAWWAVLFVVVYAIMSKRPRMVGEVFGWCGIARRCAAGGLEMRMKSRFSHLGQPRPPQCRAPPAHGVHLGARKPCARSGRKLEQEMRVYTIFNFASSCATTGNMNPGRRGSSKRLAARGQSREFGQKGGDDMGRSWVCLGVVCPLTSPTSALSDERHIRYHWSVIGHQAVDIVQDLG